jgi:hypothetical protein
MVRVTTSMGIGNFFDFPPLGAVYEGEKVFSHSRSFSDARSFSISDLVLEGVRELCHLSNCAGRREDEECCLSSAISPVCRVARHLNCRYYPIVRRRRRRAIGSHGPITSHHIAMIRHAEKRGEINKFQSLLFFPLFVCVIE